ncbi:MAG: RecX family transcriptional regulator [Muribaculaceae bacterium]|nr:RecX family transcriptional regulator [Muribaculaceae bacterium]
MRRRTSTGKNGGSKERRVTPEGMRLQLAGLCARSEQNEYDLRQKMRRKGLTPEETEGIIEFLKEGRYLDEERYARAYANDKVRFSGWGINKIRQGLRMKRVPGALIDKVIDGIDRKEYMQSLKRAGIAKARETDIRTPEGRAKFYRHLANRGYESSLIIKLSDAILKKLNDR